MGVDSSSPKDSILTLVVVGVLTVSLAALFGLFLRTGRPTTPTPTATTTPRPPVTVTVTAGYSPCTHEDGTGATIPCFIDCAATPQWCSPGQTGAILRWPDSVTPRPSDSPYRGG